MSPVSPNAGGPLTHFLIEFNSLIVYVVVTYYFDAQKSYATIRGRDLKKLKGHTAPQAKSIAIELSKIFLKNIYRYWTRRDTFGFVFTDFEFLPVKNERLIGRGEKDLFAKTKDDFYFIVLSKTLDRNFKQIKFGDHSGLVVNLNYYKEFLSIIRNRKKTVELFLQKLSKEEETLIRNWLRSYEKFEEVKEEALVYDVESIIKVLRRYKIESASDLEKIITISRASGSKITESWKFFEPILIEFKRKIDGDCPEPELRRFLIENPWLIDFSFLRGYQKYEEQSTSVGDVDISFYKDEMGIEKVCVVELKKASEPIASDKYRGKEKPVILAEVGKALSQAMHYIEDLKRRKRIINGIVIVGRRREVKDWFIDQFNQYLHGIEVKTYDELYERANDIIEIFKSEHASYSTVKTDKKEEKNNSNSGKNGKNGF
jgi:hypothetical protein